MNTKTTENSLLKLIQNLEDRVSKLEKKVNPSVDKDELFNKAINTIKNYEEVSASLLQRRLMIGYARAARILDELEQAGYIGPGYGAKPREVLNQKIK